MPRRTLDVKWTILLLRSLVAAAFAVLYFLPGRESGLAAIFLCGYVASNLLLSVRDAEFFQRRRLAYFLVVIDTLLVGTTVFLLEGWFTEFYYLYFFTIFLCALLRDMKSGVAAAVLAYAVYLLVLQDQIGPGQIQLQEALVKGCFLLATAGLTTYLTQEVQRTERDNLTLSSVMEVSQQMSSTLEPEDLFRLLLAKVSEIIPVQRLSLIRVAPEDPREGTVIATLENPRQRPFQVDLGKYPEIMEAIRAKRRVVVSDVEKDPLMGEVKETLAASRPASILVFPIVQRDQAIGTLFLKTERPRSRFQPWELDFCQVIANAAGQAIFAARALQQEKRRTSELELVNAFDAFLVPTLGMAELQEGAVSFFRRSFDMDFVGLALKRDVPNFYVLRAHAIAPDLADSEDALQGAMHLSDSLLATGKPLTIRKGQMQGDYVALLDELREEVFLPLLAGSRLMGCLVLASRTAGKSEDALLLLQMLANHLALALDKSLLHAQVEELNRQLSDRVTEQDRYLGSLVSLSADAIIGLNRQGRIESWNRGAERIFGYDSEAILGESAHRLFPHATNGDGPDALIRQAIEKRDIQNLEVRTVDAQGREKVVDLTLSAIESAWGSTKGISLIARDVTQRRKLEQRVAQAERMAAIGEVAAGVAHEIRNPLFAISSIAQILGMECGTSGELVELTQAMGSEIQRLNRIVEDLLTFGRRRDLEMRTELPGRVVDDLLAMNAAVFQERGLRLQRVDAEPGFAFRFDPEQMRQVFLNLVLNAAQASEREGVVRVESAVERGGEPHWWLSVTNGGPGIPREVRERVFELFFTTKEKGSGIGLALSKKIVEAHEGTLAFTSEPGETVFTVRLPLEES
ncbi:MAG: GAF domain-containing protein [Gemmatimonadetes bacterium]|nr:GAF domain-containing protein [Gemmatimonadota bacterium]